VSGRGPPIALGAGGFVARRLLSDRGTGGQRRGDPARHWEREVVHSGRHTPLAGQLVNRALTVHVAFPRRRV